LGLRSLIFGKGYKHRQKNYPFFSYQERPRLDENGYFELAIDNVELVKNLYNRTSKYWRGLASDPKEIYWSVLSNSRFKGVLSKERKNEFFASGEGDIRVIMEIYRRFCPEPFHPIALDFGSGVGRLSIHAAKECEYVYSVDFSPKHLSEASAIYEEKQVKNAECIEIGDLSDLDNLPHSNLIYSLIVLQHNTPPVMAVIVSKLLASLKYEGIAVLHIPIAYPNYYFDPIQYLNSEQSGKKMEVHILPKNNINELAALNRCSILATYSNGGAGDYYSEWIVFQKNTDDLSE